MSNEKKRELYDAMIKAENEWLKLRDAKSNGCLGFDPPIIKVMIYDEKMTQAYNKYVAAKTAYWSALGVKDQ
jgi:hypothetical protein